MTKLIAFAIASIGVMAAYTLYLLFAVLPIIVDRVVI